MSLAKNTVYSFITFSSRMLTGTILMFYFGRTLSMHDFGVFNYALTYSMIILMLLWYGYNLYLVREISQERLTLEKSLVFTVVPKLLITLLCAAATLIFIRVFAISADISSMIWILVAGSLLNSWGQFVNALQKGKNIFSNEVVVAIVQNLLIIILSLFFIHFYHANIFIIGWVYVFSYFVGFMISIANLIPLLSRDCNFEIFDMRESVRLFKEATPFAMATIFMILYFQVDTLVIGHYMGPEEVAKYQAVIKIISVCLILPDILFNSFFPRLSKTLMNSAKEKLQDCFLLTSIFIIIGCGFSAILMAFSDTIMTIIYKHRYDAAIHVMYAFVPFLIIRYLAMAYGILVVASRNQIYQLVSSVAATVLSLLLNIVLVPRLGIVGSVWAACAVNFVIFVFYFFVINKIYRINFIDHRAVALGMLCLCGGSMAYMLRATNFALAVVFLLVWLLSILAIFTVKSGMYVELRSKFLRINT